MKIPERLEFQDFHRAGNCFLYLFLDFLDSRNVRPVFRGENDGNGYIKKMKKEDSKAYTQWRILDNLFLSVVPYISGNILPATNGFIGIPFHTTSEII